MSPGQRRLHDLQAARALGSLDDREAAELPSLAARFGTAQQDDSFDLAVAAVALAGIVDARESIPERLHDSLLENALRHFDGGAE